MRDEFYVGYLPTPTGVKRFVRVAAPVLIVLGGLVVGLVAGAMRSPGEGAWDLESVTEVTGTIRSVGHPVLVGDDGGTYLLVGELKTGIGRDVEDGARVTVRGNRLERDGLTMLSLTSSPDTFEVSNVGRVSLESNNDLASDQEISLRGEIVDSKCFLGAMKPGNGKSHKACAILCLRGGVPALLVSPEGEATLLVTADDRGGFVPLSAEFYDFVGEPVVVEGRVVDRAGAYNVLEVGSVVRP